MQSSLFRVRGSCLLRNIYIPTLLWSPFFSIGFIFSCIHWYFIILPYLKMPIQFKSWLILCFHCVKKLNVSYFIFSYHASSSISVPRLRNSSFCPCILISRFFFNPGLTAVIWMRKQALFYKIKKKISFRVFALSNIIDINKRNEDFKSSILVIFVLLSK